MTHLNKSNTEYGKFVKEQYFNGFIGLHEYREKRDSYDDFLSEQLNPSMFVPAVFEDGKWVVLKEPKGWKAYIQENGWKSLHPDALYRCSAYSQSLKNVYFEGFELKKLSSNVYGLQIGSEFEILCSSDFKEFVAREELKTIEDLIPYNLKLSQTIKNRIGV